MNIHLLGCRHKPVFKLTGCVIKPEPPPWSQSITCPGRQTVLNWATVRWPQLINYYYTATAAGLSTELGTANDA